MISEYELYEGDVAGERRNAEILRRAATCDHDMDNFFLEVEADLPHHQQGFSKTVTRGAGEPLAKRFKTSGVLSETMQNVADAFQYKCSPQTRALLDKAIASCDVELFLRLVSSALI